MQLPIGQEIASAALLDGIFQNAPMVFYVVKADGSHAISYISPNVEKMLGCTPAELLASPSCWQDRVHPEDLERVMRELGHLFETGHQIVEYRILGAQGGHLWVKDEINLVRPPDDTPAYLSGYWYDISAHKNQEATLLAAQLALQEKDRFLQSVLDNIPQRLFWKDRLSAFRGCNLAGAREVGLERPEDIEGKTDFNLHHNPTVADYLRKTDEDVMAAGKATYHAAVPLHQGEIWLDVTKVPLHDENGVVTGLLVSYEDVSTQKKNEITLRNFKRAVEQSSNTIIITNPEGDIEYINPRFLEVYGYAESEVLGKNPRLLKSAATSVNTYQDLWQTIKGGKSWHGELVNQTKNGEHSWQSASISPIFDEYGAITHFLAIEDDITERKHAEMALQALNETLEQRVKEETAQNMAQERLLIQQSRHAAMGEMIGNIAHQWRQPLNALGLIVQNIAIDYQDGALDQNSLAEYKKTATDTIQKMSRTIDDFRNFFRPNHLEETFSLSMPIQEALNLIDASMQNNAIAVTVDCAEELAVFGSSNEFAQVMLNLLANAKDALLEKNAPLKTIEVSAHAEENHAVVCVRDNGGGIPVESMDKIFDPYFTSKESGTGIGLYMTRVIVEQHMHGKITCRNTEDGAEFLLSLPRKTSPA